MKSRETLIRLKKFQVDEKRRRVSQIEGMIADFQRMSVDLEREIQTEQERAGINDPSHFAYPTYAKAAIQRRENLTRSADELRIQLEDAKSMLTEAFEELKKVELLDDRAPARATARWRGLFRASPRQWRKEVDRKLERPHGVRDQQHHDGERDQHLEHGHRLGPARQDRRIRRPEGRALHHRDEEIIDKSWPPVFLYPECAPF